VNGDLQFIWPRWSAPHCVRAAFTLRSGGVSVAPYDSLNMGAGIGDSVEAVAENRRRVRAGLPLPSEPVWLEQVHGIEIAEIGEAGGVVAGVGGRAAQPRGPGGGIGAEPSEALVPPPRADASVTRTPGRVCAIRVADCMPVLFAARDGSAVGAAHAGWRGLAGGVLEATIRRMGVPATQLVAWMGPAIGPDHFEVGDDVRAAFLARDEEADGAFVGNARGRWQCDLYALARRNLTALGVEEVFGGGWCTFAEVHRFFSYRRDGQCGRMAALIWLQSGGD
jgi:purine-nucleoside/S-methyl-5'-thioadenosine phosphorylase / adenosine deaminase